MKFRLVETPPDMVSVTIRPFAKNESHMKNGEWEWETTADEKVLRLAIDPYSSEREIENTFRKFAFDTKHRWGDVPTIDFSEFREVAAPAVHGVALSNYRLDWLKAEKDRSDELCLYILSEELDQELLNRAEIEAEVKMRVMHLVDLPPNKKRPSDMGQWARESAKEYGFDCEVWNDDHVISAELSALHAVGRGSAHDPVFIVSKYFGRKEDQKIDLALVGKGVTFDAGGISIKPATNMHFMKSDMAGGAAMLGAIELAARLGLKINLAAIVPAAENTLDGKSLLPGEVIQTYSGKTVEVIDTDAEGRLILADALSWTVRNLKPENLIDMATLTGSSVRALGFEAAALYSNDENLSKAIYDAGLASGDKCWPMPLWKEYASYVESDVADLANLPAKPVAGSIAAAKFLEAFIDDHPKWAHIDMPGMSFQSSPYAKNKSATGYGISLLSKFMAKLAKTSS